MINKQNTISEIKVGLGERYLAPIKEKSQLFLGIELEFPLVHRQGFPTDTAVTKNLMTYLLEQGFVLDKADEDGNPISLKESKSGDNLLFECSYTTLEIAFAKAKTIQEVEARFDAYLTLIQAYLAQFDHELVGSGINPSWQINDNRPVKHSRYQMLSDYLALGKFDVSRHDFVDYGSYICSSQVQFDVSQSNYLRVLNAFNQIEAAKAYLFPNSPFPEAGWDTTISRDNFWELSMHGKVAANVGVYPTDFESADDLLTYLSGSALFTTTRDEKTVYFSPRSLVDYFSSREILATALDGSQVTLEPEMADLSHHRSYHYQVLTTRGTVELRSVCTQPLAKTFAPVAFQLGLLTNLDQLEAYLATCAFFKTYDRDYPALRKQFSALDLSLEEKVAIQQFADDLLLLATDGLVARGFGEETYLKPLLQE